MAKDSCDSCFDRSCRFVAPRASSSRLAWGLTAPVVRRAWQLLGPPQAAVRMAKGPLVAAAAALVAMARAQQASQCTPQYLAQVQALCCDDGRGNDVCNGGQPSRCNGNCATMFLDFYDNCELQGQDRDMDALATTCRSTVRCPESKTPQHFANLLSSVLRARRLPTASMAPVLTLLVALAVHTLHQPGRRASVRARGPLRAYLGRPREPIIHLAIQPRTRRLGSCVALPACRSAPSRRARPASAGKPPAAPGSPASPAC